MRMLHPESPAIVHRARMHPLRLRLTLRLIITHKKSGWPDGMTGLAFRCTSPPAQCMCSLHYICVQCKRPQTINTDKNTRGPTLVLVVFVDRDFQLTTALRQTRLQSYGYKTGGVRDVGLIFPTQGFPTHRNAVSKIFLQPRLRWIFTQPNVSGV